MHIASMIQRDAKSLCISAHSFSRFSTRCLIGFLLVALTMVADVSTDRSQAAGEAEAVVTSTRIQNSIENTLASHRAELLNLKAKVEQLESLKGAVQNEINAYNSGNAAHSRLLLEPHLHIGTLENAFIINLQTSRKLAGLL